MKKKISVIGIGLIGIISLTGCVGIKYTSTSVLANGATNTTLITANRFIWSTENYNCVINTNGTGSLQATKSNVDAAAITAIGQLIIQAMSQAK
jgi:hypothetical protein